MEQIDQRYINATSVEGETHGGVIHHALPVSLVHTNFVAQYAAGAPINDVVGPFTEFHPTRTVRMVLGVGGANPVTVTIYYTDIATGLATSHGYVLTGAGTYDVTDPAIGVISRITTSVDPGGTLDVQANDVWVYPPARRLIVGVAGDVIGQLDGKYYTGLAATDVTLPLVAGDHDQGQRIIRATGTTATGLVLGW